VKPARTAAAERRTPGGTVVLKDRLRAAGHDLVDRAAVVRVIDGEILLADDSAAVRGDRGTHPLVHHMRQM